MESGGLSSDQRREEQETNANREFKYKFNLFITALIFATLSVVIQHPIDSNAKNIVKIMEIVSWIILFLSGYFSLVVCSGFPIGIISKPANKLNVFFNKEWTDEILMWRLFYFSLFLLLVVKAIGRFN